MFQVSVEETFSSGHALRGYRGKCENVHGHNYRVRVTVEGPQLDSIGLLCDFTELKRVLREIIGGLDHQFINDLEAFRTVNPSAENLAKYFYDEVTRQLTGLPAGSAGYRYDRLGNGYSQRAVPAWRVVGRRRQFSAIGKE